MSAVSEGRLSAVSEKCRRTSESSSSSESEDSTPGAMVAPMEPMARRAKLSEPREFRGEMQGVIRVQLHFAPMCFLESLEESVHENGSEAVRIWLYQLNVTEVTERWSNARIDKTRQVSQDRVIEVA